MKQIFLSTMTDLEEIQTFEPGAWINLVNPSQSESMEVAEHYKIDIADLRAPLDAEESSRITVEDDYTLILVDVPILEERNNKTYYITIPLGIILTDDAIITTCLEPLPLFEQFIHRRLRNFFTFMKSRFVFQILYRNAQLYLSALRTIDRKSEEIEKQLHEATRNEELIVLMELEKPSSTSRLPSKPMSVWSKNLLVPHAYSVSMKRMRICLKIPWSKPNRPLRWQTSMVPS